MKWLISWVFPGFPEVFAKLFLLTKELIREDFPTLDLPIKAYSARVGAGHFFMSVLLITNSAFLICMSLYTVFR